MLGRLVLASVVVGKTGGWVGWISLHISMLNTDSNDRLTRSHAPTAEHEGALGEDVEEALTSAPSLRACEVGGGRVLSVSVTCVCVCVKQPQINPTHLTCIQQ